MRLDARDAMSGPDIGDEQILKERRFSSAGLAEDGEVPATIVHRQADQIPLRAKLRAGKADAVRPIGDRGNFFRRRKLAAVDVGQCRHAHGFVWRMEQRRDFFAGQQKSWGRVDAIDAAVRGGTPRFGAS